MTEKNFEFNLKIVLFASISFLALIYFHYFVLLPQSWTLNNDYLWLLDWRDHPHFYWQKFFEITKSEMTIGRFHPYYNLYIVFLYYFLPIKPVIFRICQIFLLGKACFLLADILKRLSFDRVQILFAELLFIGNLTIKDWITLPAAFEPVAIVCFLFSISAYLRGNRILALCFFIFTFLSKESFFVLLPSYFILEFYLRGHSVKRDTRLKSFTILSLFTLAALVFVVFVSHLPRVYTAGKFASLPIKQLLIAFFIPPVKTLGPALLLGLLGLWSLKYRQLRFNEKIALALGVCIVVVQTLILTAWGPFDSWFYLHMAIPLGWVFILSALWSPLQMKLPKKVHGGLITVICGFLILLTIHGSHHLYTDLNEAKESAEIACHDFTENPQLKVYTNCNEGSVELHAYLTAYKICKIPPEITWTGSSGTTLLPRENYEVLYSPKCDAFTLTGNPKSQIKLEYWTVTKY